MKVKYNIPISTIVKKVVKNTNKLQPILNLQVVKDSNLYAPKDEGTLQSSGLKSDMNKKYVEWKTIYAHYLYVGDDYHFSKDSNPLAQARWFEKAKALNKKKWLAMLQKEVDS